MAEWVGHHQWEVCKMRFKQWFETMTSTACVANFARPIMPMVQRKWPETATDKIKVKKKKKKS